MDQKRTAMRRVGPGLAPVALALVPTCTCLDIGERDWMLSRVEPRPGAACARPEAEGPPWGPACANGRDDDCDGQVDTADPSCRYDLQACGGGWCREGPALASDLMEDVWVADDGTAWAVGRVGVIQRWDGQTWRQVDSGAEASLTAVWGFASDDVWAVGYATVLHWDGRVWSPVEVPHDGPLWQVWGAAPGDLWVQGGDMGHAVLLHRVDGAWSRDDIRISAAMLDPMWATAADDVWHARSDQGLLHWDGARWTEVVASLPCRSVALWGSGAGELWIACNQDHALRWDGSGFEEHGYGVDNYFSDAWVGPDGQAWLVGSGGTLLHQDGAGRWVSVASGVTTTLARIHGSAAAGLAFAVGNGALLRLDLDDETARAIADAPTAQLYDLTALSADELWAVGSEGTVLHRLQGEWRSVASPTQATLRAVWARSADDVWMVGDGVVLRWDGAGLQQMPVAADLRAVWAAAEDDAWAAGDGALLRWDGSAWQPFSSPEIEATGSQLFDLWGCRADQVWLAGAFWAFLWDGQAWSTHPIPEEGWVRSVSGSSCDEVWAAGQDLIVRWDGQAWVTDWYDFTFRWYGSWVGADDDVWVVGGYQEFAHWDGAAWTLASAPGWVSSVTGWGAHDVWATGGGAIVHLAR